MVKVNSVKSDRVIESWSYWGSSYRDSIVLAIAILVLENVSHKFVFFRM